jgi:hypothetical protein
MNSLNPIPLTPFPLLRGRGSNYERGTSSLLDSPALTRREEVVHKGGGTGLEPQGV